MHNYGKVCIISLMSNGTVAIHTYTYIGKKAVIL